MSLSPIIWKCHGSFSRPWHAHILVPNFSNLKKCAMTSHRIVLLLMVRSKSGDHSPVEGQVAYPIVFKVLYFPGGWEWDFWTINSIYTFQIFGNNFSDSPIHGLPSEVFLSPSSRFLEWNIVRPLGWCWPNVNHREMNKIDIITWIIFLVSCSTHKDSLLWNNSYSTGLEKAFLQSQQTIVNMVCFCIDSYPLYKNTRISYATK